MTEGPATGADGSTCSPEARPRASATCQQAARPDVDAETVARQTGVHVNGVRRSIAPLVEAGIVVGSQHHGSHEQLYRAAAILDLLDAYAAEVGRRQR